MRSSAFQLGNLHLHEFPLKEEIDDRYLDRPRSASVSNNAQLRRDELTLLDEDWENRIPICGVVRF